MKHSTRPGHTTHACPGGCGARVERHLYACRVDWGRLPAPLRQAISRAYHGSRVGEHARAMDAAAAWFMRNPREQ